MPAATGASREILELLEDGQDLEYEEEIARNPYSLKNWLKYLDAKPNAKPVKRYFIYERALKFLPGSYKLWHAYLVERKKPLDKVPITHAKYQILANTYQRALVHLSKMPRIWLEYCQLLCEMKKGTATRRAFDQALQALPITQHHRVWELYIPWIKEFEVKDTAIRVYRRFLKYDPSFREEYVDYLEKHGEIDEAAQQLAICVNDDSFISPKGSTKHQLWMRLCDLCAKNPTSVSRKLQVDAIIRSGLSRFTDEVGKLWCRLADYYIRLGHFERARDVYEEALTSVLTVRDFTTVFDAYAQCEESLLTARIQMLDDQEADEDDDEEEKVEDDLDVEGDDTELRLARLEDLMERRPVALNSVLLRQNPHNVHEWHKRAKLFKDQDNPRKVIVCYTEAVKTVDPAKALGKPHTLWLAFAKYYEEHDDLDNARVILDKATLAPFKAVDDLASVYTAWAEMELRHENYDKALEVMQHAVTEPSAAIQRRRQNEAQGRAMAQAKKGGAPVGADGAVIPVQERVHRSTKVWSLYLDLEESLGTVETTKAAYDRALELKIATPQMILNFATFLEENKYFEEAFRVYEKGVSVFGFPHAKPIWTRYLDNFVQRYGGSKLERARDLFEQCLEKLPPQEAPEFYIKYAKLEEEFGLARHAMAIYDRASKAVPEDKRYDMYRLYIKKVEALYGVIKTREVYERAIEALPDDQAKKMCLEYAEVERKLGEIDRARGVFIHGANMADPKRDPGYWKKWQDFEVNHGNEETFRDMLRVKRTVQTAFSQVNYMAAEMVSGETVTSDAEALAREQSKQPQAMGTLGSGVKRKAAEGGSTETDMEALERQARKIQAVTQGKAPASANPEEISLDEDEEESAGGAAPAQGGGAAKEVAMEEGGEEEEDEAPMDVIVEKGEDGEEIVKEVRGDTRFKVKEKPIPAAVFQRAGLQEGEAAEAALGALERMKGGGGKKKK